MAAIDPTLMWWRVTSHQTKWRSIKSCWRSSKGKWPTSQLPRPIQWHVSTPTRIEADLKHSSTTMLASMAPRRRTTILKSKTSLLTVTKSCRSQIMLTMMSSSTRMERFLAVLSTKHMMMLRMKTCRWLRLHQSCQRLKRLRIAADSRSWLTIASPRLTATLQKTNVEYQRINEFKKCLKTKRRPQDFTIRNKKRQIQEQFSLYIRHKKWSWWPGPAQRKW